MFGSKMSTFNKNYNHHQLDCQPQRPMRKVVKAGPQNNQIFEQDKPVLERMLNIYLQGWDKRGRVECERGATFSLFIKTHILLRQEHMKLSTRNQYTCLIIIKLYLLWCTYLNRNKIRYLIPLYQIKVNLMYMQKNVLQYIYQN